MRRAVLLVALLAFSALATPVAAQAGPFAQAAPLTQAAPFAQAAPATQAGPFAQTAPSISPAGTTFVVQLQRDGDARWQVTSTYSLEDDNETTAFRRYARDYEDGDAVGGPNATFFRTAADRAEVVAGRNMTVENVSRSGGVVNGTGELTLTFVWTNFLERDGRQLVLHDALLTPENGTWLGFLAADQRMVVRTPPGYAINFTSDPLVQRNRSFIVDGPRDFDGDAFAVRYTRSQGPTTPPQQSLPWQAIVAGGVVLAVVLVSALAWQRRGDSAPSTTGGGPGPDSDTAATTGAGDGGGSGATAGADEAAGASGGAAGDEAGADDEPDLTLLSDEERVEHILERHGGRMRQADIVAETDWSDAKVSQLLSKMADEGRVEKLRLGRENLISLPDRDEGDE